PFICPRRFGMRVLVVCDLMFAERRFGLSAGALYRRLKIGRSVKQADLIICISETTKREVTRKWPNMRPAVIPCALDGVFCEPFEMQRPRDKVFRLIHFGGTIPSKCTGLLLKAISRVISDGERVEVVIGGVSEHRSFIHKLAADCGLAPAHYTILPRLSDVDLVRLYRKCNLHCMPSLGEGFGLPVIEAAS